MPTSVPPHPSNASASCAQCASPLLSTAPGGLCAKCLLLAGLPDSAPGRHIANAGARTLVAPPEFPFVFGNYRILSLLGRGGMGAVYEAEHLHSGRRVALKILAQTIDLAEARKRFLREGLLAASINHPNCVYVFGTEEIEGHPVIAMELVPGGTTLRDRIRSKPLPPKEAVDAALQVLAGLEAAHAKGIVHRDLKPTNCFVAPDGTVKVGDFGLSVSTLAAHETHLTASGHLLGTPAYASPEQLRGGSLDLRSDIYSLGATLFSLLTGRPPFEGKRAVEVVAAVLETSPRSPSELASQIPRGLARVVLRCLAKRPEERFANYHELRTALLPFSSSVPEPAPIPQRLAAGVIDFLIFWIGLEFCFSASQISQGNIDILWQSPLGYVFQFGFVILHDALLEGLWGASLGKRLLGLRVISNQGGSSGLWRAALRSLLFLTPTLALFAVLPKGLEAGFLATASLWLFTRGLLFLPLLHRPNRGGFHDQWTNTSVTLASSLTHFTAPPHSRSQTTPPPSSDAAHLGPFRVICPLSEHWTLAFDDSLQRHVWIHCPPLHSAPLLPSRISVARKTRLRWIAGIRSAQQAWDAFDAPDGCPLLDLPRQPWESVRSWLSDLTDEFALASREHSLPEKISLAHIWITSQGRALLLDEPAPGASQTAQTPGAARPVHSLSQFQTFLAELTDTFLEPDGLPLHAHDFLRCLQNTSFVTTESLQGQLVALHKKPTRISATLKTLLLGSATLLSVASCTFSGLMMVIGISQIESRWAVHPEIRPLEASAAIAGMPANMPMFFLLHRSYEDDPSEKKTPALRYLTAKFGPLILSPESDHTLPLRLWNPNVRERLRKAVREQPPVSEAELEEATRIIEPYIEKCLSEEAPKLRKFNPMKWLFVSLVPILTASALLQLLSVLVIDNPLGAQLCGLRILGPDGHRASRPRLLLRWFLAWTFVALPWLAGLLPASPFRTGLVFITATALITQVTAFIFRSKPGLHETLSKTRLVRA